MFVRMQDSRLKLLFVALMAVALLGACGDDGSEDDDATETSQDAGTETEETPAEDAGAGTLEFHATEYAFSVEPTVPAGQTSVTLVNKGEEPHILTFVPLAEDAPSVEKLVKMPQKKAQSFFAGPPNDISKPVKPGETSAAIDVELTPGRWGYACFFGTKQKGPHAFLGMVGELTVE
jgi:plastocyanin